MYIEAFFNDEPLSLGGCTAGEACKVSDFSAYLKSIIAYDKVSEACKVSAQEAPEFIQWLLSSNDNEGVIIYQTLNINIL